MASLTNDRLRLHENIPIQMIETICTFSGKLEMLTLVLSHWNMCCPMDQNIGGLKDRV